MKHISVFISGPGASFNVDYRKAFRREENRLRHRGYGVICLATAFPDYFDRDTVMRFCLDAVPLCDAMLMLPGWEQSMGAREERDEALKHGIPVFHTIEGVEKWRAAREQVDVA